MSTVANVMPCPCCDRGGFNHEPCPSRLDIDKLVTDVRRLRAAILEIRKLVSSDEMGVLDRIDSFAEQALLPIWEEPTR